MRLNRSSIFSSRFIIGLKHMPLRKANKSRYTCSNCFALFHHLTLRVSCRGQIFTARVQGPDGNLSVSDT